MRRWRGVTLIEMLVAMGVAAVLTVSLAGVLRGAVSAWRDLRRQARLDQRARVVLDRLGLDARNRLPFPAAPEGKEEDRLVLFTTAVGPSPGTDSGRETRFVRVTWRTRDVDGVSTVEREEEPLSPTPEALPPRRSAVPGRLRFQHTGRIGVLLELTEDGVTARYATGFP
ncbi:MAG: prepilin-type N-terminal cleavage/methylation domain-containing protein [Elusimicrobia bacterium]|nr:prepilin-type N-terminal cleavage/methylation domain-containing protein [Elusimicrobiota bacterium]MBK7208699.1 prepilin-type N-terminal cleavage/methylation domain-containing protein [Elusimicrobiota bacterium]MBK7545442.1 prepilin-type N-terminal cleavage/methylation domain-containing protein [Elusimicrobiota bacterium]MBK7575542.1 prepilin-type N-terminal cleavage/methylation domain-containing protein [Elusimicrobiota bacterium]MBK7688450.1 prepilin-type N-terminal cleavage/methylation do